MDIPKLAVVELILSEMIVFPDVLALLLFDDLLGTYDANAADAGVIVDVGAVDSLGIESLEVHGLAALVGPVLIEPVDVTVSYEDVMMV